MVSEKSLSFGFGKFGIVKKVSVSVSVKILVSSFSADEQGNIENFKIQVESVFKKPLTRQKTEAVKIQSSRATHIMNSKAEHRQPAMLRVRMTRENDDDGTNNGQRQGGKVARGDVVRRAGD